MENMIITVAVTGGITSKEDNPNLPITPEEIAQDVYNCWNAGASIAHIHAREINGTPTQCVEVYQDIIDRIRERCDIVINLTTTGWNQNIKYDCERWDHLKIFPEMATFTPGSMNRKNSVMINSPDFIRKLANELNMRSVKPEIEIFDLGMIGHALKIQQEGLLEKPLHFQFVLGVDGGIPATPKNLLYLVEVIPDDSTWSVAAVGRGQLPMNLLGMTLGGHIRTGFEDNIYYHYRDLATSNAQLVERLVRYAKDFDRVVATPEDARRILKLRYPVCHSNS